MEFHLNCNTGKLRIITLNNIFIFIKHHLYYLWSWGRVQWILFWIFTYLSIKNTLLYYRLFEVYYKKTWNKLDLFLILGGEGIDPLIDPFPCFIRFVIAEEVRFPPYDEKFLRPKEFDVHAGTEINIIWY